MEREGCALVGHKAEINAPVTCSHGQQQASEKSASTQSNFLHSFTLSMLHHTLLLARTVPVALARTASPAVIRPAASQHWQRLQQLQWPRQSIHSSGSLQWPRKPRNAHGGGGIRDRHYFGNYTRLAPTSLRLGVVPPDVDSLIPSHIQRPSYALRGEPSEWSAGIPVNDSVAIEKCRKAGQLAKKILELGGTLAKVTSRFLSGWGLEGMYQSPNTEDI